MLLRLFVPAVLTSTLAFVGLHSSAHAADFTDLLDAADDLDDFDDTTYDPFDFNIEPRFRFDTASARISREAPCVPLGHSSLNDPMVANNPRLVVDSARCTDPQVVFNKEMEFEEMRSMLDITLRAGLYKDLELHLTVPYVFSSTRGLRYADDVDASNSSIDPATGRIANDARNAFSPTGSRQQHIGSFDQFNLYRYFELSDEFASFERSGFGDPSIGLHWAPFNDERDDTKATLLVGMDYVMPIAPIARRDNTAVGRGVHELQWKVAASKRFDWIEPYFGLQYFLPLPATDSPLRAYNEPGNVGQVITSPPHRGLITVGTEFIPHQDERTGARYAIDLRFQFGYVSEGRDYTPLFDHMSNSDCNGLTVDQVLPQFDGQGNLTNPDQVACAWIVRQASNARPTAIYDIASENTSNSTFNFDGIMTVESYGTFAGQVGFYLQPSKHFELRLVGGLTHFQQHFLTNARTGRNASDSLDDTVSLTGPDARIERNPVYNPSYDSPGNRFRVEQYNNWHFSVTTALQF